MKDLLLESLSTNKSSRRKSFGKKELLHLLGGESVLHTKDDSVVLGDRHRFARLSILLLALLFVFLTFISRAFIFQLIKGNEYFALSEKNSIRNFTIQAERGVIYDRNNKVIVRNKPSFSLELSVDLCKSKETQNKCVEELDLVSTVLEVEKPDILRQIKLGKRSILLNSGIPKSQTVILEPKIAKYKALELSIAPVRDYIYGDAYAHVTGYVGLADTVYPQIVGKAGIEKYYDEILAGFPGSKIVQVDSASLNYALLSEYPPLPGRNVKLNLDIELQKEAYEMLKQAIEKNKAKAGSIVAQNPQTGGILALVNYPSFDPNKLTVGLSQKEFNLLQNSTLFPFFNRAISGIYPPGSVFKMFVAAGALEEKVIKKDTTIDDKGFLSVAGYTFRNWKLDGHGVVNLVRALQVSNDTYFYTIGGGYGAIRGLGIEKLNTWVRKFGFGALTNIDLEGESKGYIPNGKDRPWYLGDTYITSIGQGDVLTTPLQINNGVTYFANGGKLFVPSIVSEIDGESPKLPQLIAKDLILQQNYNLIVEGMKAAVNTGGTGYPVFDFTQKHPGIELAGKTGTAEYTDAAGKNSTHAWFTVFGPLENSSIVLTVFLEGGGSGSDDAAPIARKLLDFWFK